MRSLFEVAVSKKLNSADVARLDRRIRVDGGRIDAFAAKVRFGAADLAARGISLNLYLL